MKKTVILYEINGPNLIVPANTDVIYINQTWGTTCFQDQLEGFLIPLDGDFPSIKFQKGFNSFIETLFPEGNCGNIDLKNGKSLESFFKTCPTLSGIRINWNLFEKSHEAWVHVIVNDIENGSYQGLYNQEAVLTWPNSD